MPEIVTLSPTKQSGGRFPILTDRSGANLPMESFYSPKYDAGYRRGINQQYNRANNQGWLQQLGYGLLSRTASIGTKSLAALGSVGTALTVPFTENTIDDIWNNPLTQWMNSIDEDLSEVFPVFQSQKYEEGNLLQKMGTTSFWATDSMDVAAFAASAFIPGKLIGAGLNKLGTIAKSADLGAGLLSKLSQLDPHKANLVLSTAYNTIAEAGAEAYQTQKELESIYISQGLKPEEAKVKASEAAREVFGANMAILAIPNYIQNSFFHGAWAKKVDAVRKAAIESNGAATAQEFLGSKWKDIVGGIASEGFWEENAQTAVQQYERALANNHLINNDGFFAEVGDNMYSNMKGFAKSVLPGTYDITPEETEGALSIALGGILGGAFGAASTLTEAKNIRKTVESENKLFSTFKDTVAPAATKLFQENVSSIHKKKGTKIVKDGENEIEVPDYVLDENGKPSVDEHALNAIVTNGLRNKFFWNAEILAAMNSNQTIGELNKEMALASYAFELATKSKLYSKENVLAALDKVTKIGQAEAEQSESTTLIRENMDVVAKYLDVIETTTNKYHTAKSSKDPKELGFRNFLTQTDLYLQTKLNAINRIRTEHQNMTPQLLESLNNLEADTLEHLKFIQEDQKAVRTIYEDLVRSPLDLEVKIRGLQEKKNKTEEEFAKLRELRYLAGENQFINGNFATLGTGAASNPIGLQSSRMVKTLPGAKDDLQFNIGESWASLKKAQQHLNSEIPDVVAAEREFNKINTAQNPDELSATAASIIEGLEVGKLEAAEILEQAKQHSEAFTVLNNIDEFVDDSLGNHIARAGGNVEATIDVLSKYVNVDADTPFTPELYTQLTEAVTTVIETMGPEVQRANQELAVLDSRIDRVRNYEDRINAKASKYTEFLESDNREEFLKRLFYETQIKAPTKEFIAFARKHKETIQDLPKATLYMEMLRDLISAYTTRTDANNPNILGEAKELLTILAEEILPIITKNINNKIAAQVITNNTAVESVLEAIKADQELFELLKNILGTDDLEKGIQQDNIKSFDALELLFQEIRDKTDEEQVANIASKLEVIRKKLAFDLNALFGDRKTPSATRIIESEDQYYGNIPHVLIGFIIKETFAKELADPNKAAYEPFHKFLKDLDVNALSLALDSMSKLSEKDKVMLREIFKLHNKVSGVNRALFNITQSKLNSKKVVAVKAALDFAIAPSLQQNIVLQDALNFLSADTRIDNWHSWFVVNGIGGSGKSHIIGSMLPAIWSKLENKDIKTSVVAFSRQAKTSANIQKQVFGEDRNFTFESFKNLTDEQLDKLSFIIIDEVYTFTNKELIEDINTKLIEYHKRRAEAKKPANKIKVIALGDPSQWTAEEIPKFNDPTNRTFNTTIPLTTTFRTNVDAIALFADAFRMKAITIDGAFATASGTPVEVVTSPQDHFGVIALDEDETIAALNKPSNRTRVLLVSTPNDVTAYKTILPNIEVLTVEQSQGYQWDEVFTILNPAAYGTDPFAVNRVLYTAFSRAKSLLTVSGLNVNNTIPSASISKNIGQEDKILGQNKYLFDQSLEGANQRLGLSTTTITREDFEPVTEEDTEEEMPMTNDIVASPVSFVTIQEPEEVIYTEEAPATPGIEHVLRFPTNYNLSPVQITDELGNLVWRSPINLNSTGHILKTTKNKLPFYYVVAPSAINPGAWVVLGALGSKDFEAQPGLSSLTTTDVIGIDSVLLNERAPFILTPAQLSQASVSTFNLNSYSRIRTNFRNTYSRDNDQLDAIEQTIVNFHATFFGIDESGQMLYPANVYNERGEVTPEGLKRNWVINGRVNWSVLKDHVEFVIMTKERLAEAKFSGNLSEGGIAPTLGLPYLVIHNPAQKGRASTTDAKSFYIQFQPIPLQQDSDILTPIKELRDAIAEVEEIFKTVGQDDMTLGTPQFALLVDMFAKQNFTTSAKNVTTKKGQAIIYEVTPIQSITSVADIMGIEIDSKLSASLDANLLKIVPLTYGAKRQKLVFKTLEEANQYLIDNATQNEDDSWTLSSNELSSDTGEPKKFTIVSVEPINSKHPEKNFVFKYSRSVEDPSITEIFEQQAIERGYGLAQHKLNALAMANEAIGEIPLRVTSTKTRGGQSIKITRSRSIFDTEARLDFKSFLEDPEVIAAGWSNERIDKNNKAKKTTQALNYLEKVLPGGRKEALALVKKHETAIVTLDTLNAVASEEQFVNGEHTSLRTPLHLHTASWNGINDIGKFEGGKTKNKYQLDNETMRRSISSQVMTNFEGMAKTSVAIGIELENAIPQPPKQPKTVKDLLDMIPTTRVPYLDRVAVFLRSIPSIQDVKIYFDTSVTIEGSTIELIQNGTMSMLTFYDAEKQEVGIAIPTSIDDLRLGSKKLISDILHEILHAATIVPIGQGQMDLAENKETKEALFVQRLTAIQKRFHGVLSRNKIKRDTVYANSRSKKTIDEFIANLSNPAFYEQASKIDATSKTSKSFIRQIIDAIIDLFSDFFSDPAKQNIYEVTFKSLEDLYADMAKIPVPSVPKVATKKEAAKTVADAKEQVEAILTKVKNREILTDFIRGILDVKVFVDTGKVAYNKLSFERKSDTDKLDILNKLYNNLLGNYNKFQFAYLNRPNVILSATTGAVIETSNLDSAIKQVFPSEILELLSSEQYNMLYSILHYQLAHAGTRFIENLIELRNQNNVEGLVAELWENVLSNADKKVLKEVTGATKDADLVKALVDRFDELDITRAFSGIVLVLEGEKSTVESIVGTIEDRSPFIYREAKNYVQDIIRANQLTVDSTTQLFQTRASLFKEIIRGVENINLEELANQLTTLYTKLSTLSPTSKEYQDLILDEIPNLEHKILGLQALNTINVKTGRKFVYDIYDEIYPQNPFDKIDEVEIAIEVIEAQDLIYNSYDVLDEELAIAAGISEYIKEYNKSYELTLSESLKDFLATVKISTPTGDRYLSPQLMYVKLMQLSATLEFSGTDTATTLERLKTQLDIKLAGELSEVDKATLETLRDTVIRARLKADVPANVTLVTGTTASGNVWYVGAVGESDISNLTYEELLSTPNVSRTEKLTDSLVLFTRLQEKYPELTILQFNQLISRAEAINTMKGIMNTMASMKETELYIGTHSIDGGYTTKMQRSKAAGISFSIKETMIESFTDKFNDGNLKDIVAKFNKSYIGGKRAADIPQNGTPKEKIEYIKKFYEELAGLGRLNVGVSTRPDSLVKLQDYVTQIQLLLGVIENLSDTNVTVAEEVLSDSVEAQEGELTDTFTSFMSDIDGYLTRFSELATLYSDYLRNPSVRTLKGDKFYKWHESSFAFDVFNTFTDVDKNSIIQGSTGSNQYRKIPTHLRSSFFNYNPFVRGPVKNKIYSTGEWEGELNSDNLSNTPYLRETYYYFYNRKFVQGFIDGIKQHKNSYFQYTYIPSDKPKHPLVRVGILSDGEKTPEILNALTSAFEQVITSKDWRLNVANYNKSKKEDPFRNFQIGKEAVAKYGKAYDDLTSEDAPKLAAIAHSILEEQAASTLRKLIADDVQLKYSFNTNTIISELKEKGLLNPKFEASLKEILSGPTDKAGKKKIADFKNPSKDEFSAKREEVFKNILPIFDLFYKNNYLNNYFLNQLVAGDYAAYKNPLDLVKRYAGVFAPGIRGFVDEEVGMKETYRTLVLEDTVVEKATTRDRLYKLFFENIDKLTPKQLAEFERVMEFFAESYEMTDAQGFMTPARARQLGRGFERYWYRGAVHKPVHFEVQQQKVRGADGSYLLDAKGNYITTPIPIYTKYSSIELTDELLTKLEEIGPSLTPLRKLRTNLERLGVDEILFKSAVKEGAPMYLDEQGNEIKEKGKSLTFAEFINATDEELNTLARIDGFKNDPSFKGSSPIMELSNRHYRLQFNAATDVNKQVPIYTQLMYFLNVFSNNAQQGVGIHPSLQAEADLVYKLIGELISIGREDFESQINTKAKFTKFLKSKFSDANGARALEFIEAGISFNNPLVEKKAIIALASGMEASTVRVKFSGAKLVLQTAEGIHYSGYDTTGLNEAQARELQYRVDTINNRRVMVAEVIVPRELLTKEQIRAVTKGESIYMYGDAIGYRIPSTELHSAVPLKVVGLYSPLNKSNVIIAPKELVPIHGSDFDVDALFVITRETFKESESTVIDVKRLNEYQELLKSFLDTYKQLNLNDQYTDQINEIQTRLNLFSEEQQDFATQLELDARWEDYVTTPNYDPETNANIIRAENDDFDAKELYYKKEWGKLNGYKIEKNKETGADNWVVTNKLLAAISELHYAVEQAPEEVKELLPKFNLLDFSNSLVGTPSTPVAYNKSVNEDGSVRYTFNPDFLVSIRTKITELEKYKDEIYSELSPLIKPVVISSIKNLKAIQTKAIKNHITETVLSIITDIDSNGARMTTPINFDPITNAISSLNGKHDKLENLDLSNPEDEYKVFYSLSSGGALVGAFANAVKDFAYLVQAGDSQSNFDLFNRNVEVQSKLQDIKSRLELLTLKEKAELTEEEAIAINDLTSQAATLKLEEVVLRKKLNAERVKSKNSNRAQINPRYRVEIDNELYHALEIREKNGKYNITETFDTLINSAIDNLKLGYLGQARINTQTGSAIVGGVFMGMSLETLVKIMYQPILRPITTGISSRKEGYMVELRSKYNLKLSNLTASIAQEDLTKGLNLSNDLSKLTEEELLSQLRIFLMFSNLNKIGEDAKHLSSFLSIIRDMQVTVEKLDNLDNIISQHIGTIDLENGILIPKLDFSFVAPNLLANTPHILEAYKTHKAIQNFISNNFLLHSPEMRQLAEKVNHGLGLGTDEATQNSAANLTDIRRAYSHYLLASIMWPNIQSVDPKIINTQTKDGKDVKFSLSKAKTFADSVANQLLALQNFAKDQGIRNMFLETAYVSKNAVGARSIQFRAGVNLNPEDHQQIAIDFRRLNRFSVDENNNVTYNLATTPYSRSSFQDALLHYAILEYGLAAGSSNYSLYIPPTYIKQLDEDYNNRLKQTIKDVQSSDSNLTKAQIPYFKVLYAMFNAGRLSYVPYKSLVKQKFDNFNRLNGVDRQITIIKDKKLTEVRDVYFDMKVEKQPGTTYDAWIKSGFKKIKGYRKVAESLTHVYYQEIGKVSEVFYTPLRSDVTEYITSDYFTPNIYTLRHFMKEGNTVYTGVYTTHFLKPGDTIYIAPNYDSARQDRELVKIVSIDKLTNAKYPGFKYVVEPVIEVPAVSVEDQVFEDKIKELGIQQICE